MLNQEKVAPNLNKVLITEEIVNKKISSLKSNKAHGDDGMGSLLLKELTNELKDVLSIIYNRSVSDLSRQTTMKDMMVKGKKV